MAVEGRLPGARGGRPHRDRGARVNDKVQLAELEAAYRRQRATTLMVEGATLADPARFDARGPVTVGRDVFIDVNVVLEGTVKLGHRVRLGPNVLIRDSEIGDDAEIHANSVIDRAVVGRAVIVGPFARLRPDAKLHEDVHVGNFVEVKKSELRRGAKANHLTYLATPPWVRRSTSAPAPSPATTTA